MKNGSCAASFLLYNCNCLSPSYLLLALLLSCQRSPLTMAYPRNMSHMIFPIVHHAFHYFHSCQPHQCPTYSPRCVQTPNILLVVQVNPLQATSQSILPHQLCGARIMFTRFCFPLPRKYVKWFGRPLVDSTTDIHTLYLIHAKKNIPVANWNILEFDQFL